jgi:asparaginase
LYGIIFILNPRIQTYVSIRKTSTPTSRIWRKISSDLTVDPDALADTMHELNISDGTIDKYYNELSGIVNFSDSHINEMLAQSRSTTEVSINRVIMKDGLGMVQEDREEMTHACEETSEEHIIIMHGTDTMPETANTTSE